MSDLFYNRLCSAAEYISGVIGEVPSVAFILGSGLGSFGEDMESKRVINYGDVPGFPASSVSGHAGQVVFGYCRGVPVILFRGRFHFYEGHNMKDVTIPVYVAKALGVKTLVVTNAAGGVNRSFCVGDIMLIEDHINFTGTNPLIGVNDERLGPRFPDMTHAYDVELSQKAIDAAYAKNIELKRGVYLGLCGPSYETKAEIRAYSLLGADAVGMSTVAEVIAAGHASLKVVGFSCITNMATGISDKKHSHDDVLAAAARSSENLSAILCGFLENL